MHHFSGTPFVHDATVPITAGDKGLAQQPARAPLWNGHSAQQRLEGTVLEV